MPVIESNVDIQLANECDMMIWTTVHDTQENMINTVIKFLNMEKKKPVKKTELGYNYSITLHRKHKDEIEIFNAIIGDPVGYIQRLGGIGYSGLMLKDKTITKKQHDNLLRTVLAEYGFEKKKIHGAIKIK